MPRYAAGRGSFRKPTDLVLVSIICARSWNTYGANSTTSCCNTNWNGGNRAVSNAAIVAASVAAAFVNPATPSNRKCENVGFLGLAHVSAKNDASFATHAVARGFISSPKTVTTRQNALIAYSFSRLSGMSNTPNKSRKSASRVGETKSLASKRGFEGTPTALVSRVAKSLSRQFAAYVCVTFSRARRHATIAGRCGAMTCLGRKPRKTVTNFNESARSTATPTVPAPPSRAAEANSGAICVLKKSTTLKPSSLSSVAPLDAVLDLTSSATTSVTAASLAFQFEPGSVACCCNSAPT
mmetsp:Transcript_6351/g.25749  ORF Transcript_6351/g.25749 Transcript_6351/m.25749 type:complete len:297 (+) Transcript_6351:526-1416(+)